MRVRAEQPGGGELPAAGMDRPGVEHSDKMKAGRRGAGHSTLVRYPPEMPQFEMTIDEVFEIPDRGLVVCGKAVAGEIRVGDELFIKTDDAVVPVHVKFLESFHNVGPLIMYAGDNVAAGIEGIQKSAIRRGSRLIGGV